MYSDPVVREREIKNISKAYTEIADKVLPQLRRSVMTINVDLIGYTDDEIKEIYSFRAIKLNLEEMLYAATLYPDLNKKVEIYTATTRKTVP
jgi:hypothetical protein